MSYMKVRGAKRLRSTLRKAGVDVKQLRTINLEAAQIVAVLGVTTAPIGGPYKRRGRGRPRKPGRLKASVRPTATARAGVVKAGGSTLPYAGPVHWGWPRTPGRQGSGIRAQPWLANAAKATEPEWTRAYERKVHDVINSVRGA